MIITYYSGKSINDISEQCLQCCYYDNKLYYCKSPFKTGKIKFKTPFESRCKDFFKND